MLPKSRRAPLGLFSQERSPFIRKGRSVTVKIVQNRVGFRRYGVLVPKATAGRATERNRLKRFAYRVLGKNSVQSAEDVMVILKPPARSAKPEELEKELLDLSR